MTAHCGSDEWRQSKIPCGIDGYDRRGLFRVLVPVVEQVGTQGNGARQVSIRKGSRNSVVEWLKCDSIIGLLDHVSLIKPQAFAMLAALEIALATFRNLDKPLSARDSIYPTNTYDVICPQSPPTPVSAQRQYVKALFYSSESQQISPLIIQLSTV